jgi:hypothetical protein
MDHLASGTDCPEKGLAQWDFLLNFRTALAAKVNGRHATTTICVYVIHGFGRWRWAETKGKPSALFL